MPEQLIHVPLLDWEGHPLSTIDLYVDLAIGIGGDLWPATTQFCRLMSSYRDRSFLESLFQRKRVAELGSGTGLAGLVLERLFTPSTIAVTDLNSHVGLMQRNIALNSSRCQVMELDWCAPPDPAQESALYDVILALECVYNEDLYLPLIRTIKALGHQNTVIFLGLTRSFSKLSFFALMAEHGLRYTLIPFESIRSGSASGNKGGAGMLRDEEEKTAADVVATGGEGVGAQDRSKQQQLEGRGEGPSDWDENIGIFVCKIKY